MENKNKLIDDRPLTEEEIIHGLRIQIERDEALLRRCARLVAIIRANEVNYGDCMTSERKRSERELELLLETRLAPSGSVSEGKL